MFRAYDADRERLVAVKLFKIDLPPERVHQLVAEFEKLIAADLSHPAIARPLATGMSGVAAYLVQDYVAAESLDLAVREYGPAPAADALRVAAQLAGALDFAAIVHIHHGTLHPRDVLLSSDETRVTGVGVAQALQRVGVAAPVRRPYSAPERAGGAPIDSRGDLFSLAAVVFELLSGKRIAGAGRQAVEALTELPGVELATVRDVFGRALAENPADRYGTALAFVEALKHAFPQSAGANLQASATRQSDARKPRPKTDDLHLTTAPTAPAALPFDVPEASDRADLEFAAPLAESAEESALRPEPAFEAVDVFKPELPLVATEEQRYEEVEPAPASTQVPPEIFSGALDRTRSAIWPLILALFVGVAVGFAGGYGVGSRDRPTPAASTTPAAATGREFTETAVKEEEPKPVQMPPPAEAKAEAQPAPGPPPPPSRPAPGVVPPGLRSREAPAPTDDGRLLVRSTPAGARVAVDGRDAGVTPAVVRNLARGAHQVRVSREGYASEDRRIVITDRRRAQAIDVPLARERAAAARGVASPPLSSPEPATPGTMGRFVGGLSVDSRPTGAKVFLDGRLVGATPLVISSVPAGEHVVRLERDGYRRWSSSVRVVASEQNRVTASLER